MKRRSVIHHVPPRILLASMASFDSHLVSELPTRRVRILRGAYLSRARVTSKKNCSVAPSGSVGGSSIDFDLCNSRRNAAASIRRKSRKMCMTLGVGSFPHWACTATSERSEKPTRAVTGEPSLRLPFGSTIKSNMFRMPVAGLVRIGPELTTARL